MQFLEIIVVLREKHQAVLHRMEQMGLLRSEWGVTEKNREARFYSLTAKGHRQLALEQESWNRLTEGVGRVLRYA